MWIVAIWSFCWTLRMKRMVSQGDIRIQDLRQLGHRFTRGCSRINFASNSVRFNRSAPGIWTSVSTCGSAALGIQSCLTMYTHTRVYIYIYIGQPVAGLKRGLWGGAVHGRCWKMKKWCWKKKMWEKCGVQNQKIGVWAWCLIIPFVVLKTAKFGVKILGGWRMSKTNQPVPTYGKSMLRRNQIAATIIYCNVLLLQLELQYFNSLQQGTPPCGNTAATLSLWPNMTTFYPDPEDAVKPWNCQVKLPGFRKLEIGNKTCDPTGPTKPVDSMAQNYHQNPRSRERNLQQMRAQVIFCLVWDFRSRPFSLFLGSFLGAKRARFLTPFEVSIQRENYQKA